MPTAFVSPSFHFKSIRSPVWVPSFFTTRPRRRAPAFITPRGPHQNPSWPSPVTMLQNKEDSESSPSTLSEPGYRARFAYDPEMCIPEDQPLDDLLETAQAAADAADDILRLHFRQRVPISYKGDNSPVTVADKAVEQTVRSIITTKYPSHYIVGEESQANLHSQWDDCQRTGFVWVIDPIDGTRAFICGRPTFTTLITVIYNGCPIIGIVSQCVTRERWVGAMRRSTTLNGNPITVVDNNPDLADPNFNIPVGECVLQATTPEMFVGLNNILFRRVKQKVRNVVYGGDGYAYALLASGCGDVILEADLKVWDYLPFVPIIEGAGGYISDWGGGPLTLACDGRVIASTSYALYENIIKLLAVAENEFRLHPRFVPASENVSVRPADREALPEDPGLGNIESMTGFGHAVVERDGFRVRADVASVNSRFCKVTLKGVGFLRGSESELVALAKRMAVRGRISVSFGISFESSSSSSLATSSESMSTAAVSGPVISTGSDIADEEEVRVKQPSSSPSKTPTSKLNVTVDEAAVREARAVLDQVAELANVDKSPTISDVLNWFPKVFVRQDDGEDGAPVLTSAQTKAVLPVIKEALTDAMEELAVWRRREGALMEEDVARRTEKLAGILEEIEFRAPDRGENEKGRLSKILQNFDVDVSANPRLETELTIFADKMDLSEEITRMRAHIEMFDRIFLCSDEPVGQRLGFFLDEMFREVNTISAKAYDAPIAHLTILMKEEMEKIREQCLNLC